MPGRGTEYAKPEDRSLIGMIKELLGGWGMVAGGEGRDEFRKVEGSIVLTLRVEGRVSCIRVR